MATYYFDTSALAKLVIDEPETQALRDWVNAVDAELLTSDLARTELPRAVRRSNPEAPAMARRLLAGAELLPINAAALDAAGQVDPAGLRTLDAIHLVAALSLGEDLDGIVTYDDRFAEAARLHGLTVISPS